MTDEFKDEIRSRMGGDQHPYDRFFDVGDEVREIVDRVIRGWVGWPTDPDAAPLWAVAFSDTQNMNDREAEILDPFDDRQGTSMLNLGADPEEVDAIREYRDFVRGYTRSRGRETVTVYRFVEDPPEEAAGFDAFVLESWTDDVTVPRQFARTIRSADEGSVITIHDMSVDRLYGTPETHPAIHQKGQSEFIVSHPSGASYSDYDITPFSEWEF